MQLDEFIESVDAVDPRVGTALACLQEGRRRTLEAITGLPNSTLDEQRDFPNSIGTLLYHLAAIEMDWLYSEILTREPEEIMARFPFDVRDAAGRLTAIRGMDLGTHVKRLEQTRAVFIREVTQLSWEDYRRVRQLSDYHVTPEWVLMHLFHHEAAHCGQIQLMRTVIMKPA